MAARKASKASSKKSAKFAPDLQEAQRRNYEKLTSRSGSEARKAEDDLDSQKNIQARRQRDAEKKQEAVRAREEQIQQAFAPDVKLKDVAVATKRTELAAKQEQRRIDEGKAAAKQSEALTGDIPGQQDEGFIHEPHHPEKPGPRGSAPRSPGTPVGPDGEDVIYVTDDIAEDGTPNVSQGFVEGTPGWDGESDRDYNEVAKRQGRKFENVAAAPVETDEELINQHSPEGAELDSIKLGRPVRFVPNDAWLDPVAHEPGREKEDEPA